MATLLRRRSKKNPRAGRSRRREALNMFSAVMSTVSWSKREKIRKMCKHVKISVGSPLRCLPRDFSLNVGRRTLSQWCVLARAHSTFDSCDRSRAVTCELSRYCCCGFPVGEKNKTNGQLMDSHSQPQPRRLFRRNGALALTKEEEGRKKRGSGLEFLISAPREVFASSYWMSPPWELKKLPEWTLFESLWVVVLVTNRCCCHIKK